MSSFARPPPDRFGESAMASSIFTQLGLGMRGAFAASSKHHFKAPWDFGHSSHSYFPQGWKRGRTTLQFASCLCSNPVLTMQKTSGMSSYLI